MALKPVLPGNVVNVPTTGGAASAPAVPVWMFDAADLSDPDPGCFTTDAANPLATTQIKIHQVPLHGVDLEYILGNTGTPGIGDYFAFTSLSTGKVQFAQVQRTANGGGIFTFNWSPGAPADATPWSGVYGFSSWPEFSITQTAVNTVSSITPCPDGTVSPVTSITTVNGVIVAIS
jgi:hypothetical protein